MSEQRPGDGYGAGWGPAGGAPGYGPNPPGPAAPPPAKGTNPVVWIAVGCGALVVIGLGVVIALGFVAYNTAKTGKTVGGAFSAGVKVELDGGVLAVDAGVKTGPPPGSGGAICEKAAECCRAVLERAGGNTASVAGCANLAASTEEHCQKALETYRASSAAFGAVCPE